MRSPNAARKRSTACGVSAISGTSTIALFAAPFDDLLEQLDVDERLAAAGDAAQQEGRAGLGREERGDRLALRGGGHVRGRARDRAREEGIARDFVLRERDEPAVREPADHRGREAELRGEMHGVARAAERFERFIQRALPRRASEDAVALLERRQLHGDPRDPLRARRRARHPAPREQRRQHRPHHEADRRHVVLRDPSRQREELRRHRRLGVGRVEEVLRVLHARARGRPQHHADGAAPAHGHEHAHPRRGDRRTVGDRVREGLEERQRERDLNVPLAGHAFVTPSPGAVGMVITPRSMDAPLYGSFATSAAPSRSA